MPTKQSIQSQRLKQLMQEKGIKNSRQFALALDMDTSQFNKILNGELALPYKHAAKINRLYGTPVDWILGGDLPGEKHTAIPPNTHGNIELPADVSAIANDPKLSPKEKIEILSMQLSLERLANTELRLKLQLNEKLAKAEEKKRSKK